MSKTNIIKQCDIDDQYPTVLMETCKAILEQGIKKGEKCWRSPTESGYCGKHQTVAQIENAKEEGKYKCSTYRCFEMLTVGMYCELCISKKKNKLNCKALIAQGENRGKQCNKQSTTDEGYCKKHLEINILQEKAKEENKRVCDDGKRACKNYTIDEKLKCEECLEKVRIKERNEHSKLKESGNCLGCGCEITILINGLRKEVQRCEPCYEKLKDVESRRERNERNYLKERLDNLDRYYKEYITNASRRGLNFDITFEIFMNTVTKPCTYCKISNEVSGIDRINSTIGYINENIVPCCELCNKMKGSLTVEEFKLHIQRIFETFQTIIVPHTKHITEKKSYMRPKELLRFYMNKTLNAYIQLCIDDSRSSTFIQKLEHMKTLKLNETDARLYIKNALKSEANTVHSSNQRISKQEMFGFLQYKNVDACIQHYENVHGIPDGFKQDIEMLTARWTNNEIVDKRELERILIKYQNKRNMSK